MSNKVSVLVYSRRLGSPVRKAIMVYFAERASDNGEGVWASKSTISCAVECGRSTVIRTIKDFVAEGLLREVGKRSCRNGETIEYAINLDAVSALDRAGDVPERDPSRSGTRPAAGPDPSQSGTPTRPAAGPKPPVGTIKEPSGIDNAGANAAENPPDPPKPKKARLPEDWTPSDDDIEYALSQKLTHDEIEEIANDFHAYWTDRTDAGGRKSERGWKQTWRNRVRDQAPKFIRNRRMAGGQAPGGYGQGGSIAGIVARRRAEGQV